MKKKKIKDAQPKDEQAISVLEECGVYRPALTRAPCHDQCNVYSGPQEMEIHIFVLDKTVRFNFF